MTTFITMFVLDPSSSQSSNVIEEAPSSTSVGITVVSLCCILLVMMIAADAVTLFEYLRKVTKNTYQTDSPKETENNRIEINLDNNINETELSNHHSEEELVGGLPKSEFRLW